MNDLTEFKVKKKNKLIKFLQFCAENPDRLAPRLYI